MLERLEATGDAVQRIDFLVDFISWISRSNFLLNQQPEPIVGDPLAIYPASVEKYGIKGQSVFTALFANLDMETFKCKLCSHKVDDLEAAITHQRLDHFGHNPYQCPSNNAQW